MVFSARGIVTTGDATDHDFASRPDLPAPIYASFFGTTRMPGDDTTLFIFCASDDPIAEAGSARLEGRRPTGRTAHLRDVSSLLEICRPRPTRPTQPP